MNKSFTKILFNQFFLKWSKEVEFSLAELKLKEKKFELVKNIFKGLQKFSFFCSIQQKCEANQSEELNFDAKQLLNGLFGSDRVVDCLTRIETTFKRCPTEIGNMLNENLKLDNIEGWLGFDRIIGWVYGKLNE